MSIDEPLVVFDYMSPVSGQPRHAPLNMDWPALKKAMASLFASSTLRKSVKVAVLYSCVILTIFLINKSMGRSNKEDSNPEESSDDTINKKQLAAKAIFYFKSSLAAVGVFIKSQWNSLLERFREQPEVIGIPMPFDSGGDSEGWGVCTLRSKRRLGRSSFVQYEFDLPASDYTLPLDLGQQISLCCLDSASKVAKGEFFPYNADSKKRLGTFSILAPNRTPPENEFAIGDDAANFVS